MAASLYYKNIIVRLKQYFHLTVKSTKYTHRKVNMCAKNQEGRSKKFIKIYEGDHSNKIKLKGDQLNVTVLSRKSSNTPTQAVNNDRSLTIKKRFTAERF